MIRVVWWQMARAMALMAFCGFSQKKQGKARAQVNVQACPSPALAAPRSWSQRQSSGGQLGSWTLYLPPRRL